MKNSWEDVGLENWNLHHSARKIFLDIMWSLLSQKGHSLTLLFFFKRFLRAISLFWRYEHDESMFSHLQNISYKSVERIFDLMSEFFLTPLKLAHGRRFCRLECSAQPKSNLKITKVHFLRSKKLIFMFFPENVSMHSTGL